MSSGFFFFGLGENDVLVFWFDKNYVEEFMNIYGLFFLERGFWILLGFMVVIKGGFCFFFED